MSQVKLFVYGTLKQGQAQAGLLGRARRIPAQVTGELWDLPAGYPALRLGEGTVHGELVELRDASVLALLDRYEGVEEGLYERIEIRVRAALEIELAWTYVMKDPRARGGRRILHGDWRPARRR